MDQKKQYKNKFDNFIRYSSLGFEMMAIMGVGTFGGYKIDQWLSNDFKGFTLGLMVFSVILAIIYGTRSLLKNPGVGNPKTKERNRESSGSDRKFGS